MSQTLLFLVEHIFAYGEWEFTNETVVTEVVSSAS